MSPMSAEASVVRSYLDWLTGIPWKKRSKVKSNLNSATEILNEDHFGLDEVREDLRIFSCSTKGEKIKSASLMFGGPSRCG